MTEAPELVFTSPSTPRQSNIGAVSGRRRLRFAADLLNVDERRVTGANLTLEHLFVGLPEVLRQEGVDNWVDGGVAVRQAVSGHP